MIEAESPPDLSAKNHDTAVLESRAKPPALPRGRRLVPPPGRQQVAPLECRLVLGEGHPGHPEQALTGGAGDVRVKASRYRADHA